MPEVVEHGATGFIVDGIDEAVAAVERVGSLSRKVVRAGFEERFSGACLARRGGRIVYVRGEAGIGKTRLVEEMRRLAETQGFAIHRALVLDFGAGKGQANARRCLAFLRADP